MKIIMHVIESLQKGGAEKVLVGTVVGVNDYEHIVVTFSKNNKFEAELTGVRVICIDVKSVWGILRAAVMLSKLVLEIKPDIVHTHLYWPMIVARLSYLGGARLVSTYHSMMYDSTNVAQYKRWLQWLDKITYRDEGYLIYVSNEVKNNIECGIGKSSVGKVIYNYVDDSFYQRELRRSLDKGEGCLKCVAVGNYRKEKNYNYIIDSVSSLSGIDLRIDIFGDGDSSEYEKRIEEKDCKSVFLHPSANNVSELLSKSDVFIAASSHEGFSIALAEAMSSSILVVASDIPVFREVSQDCALYFDINDENSLSDLLLEMADNRNFMRSEMTECAKVAELYRYERFISNMKKFYNDVLSINY